MSSKNKSSARSRKAQSTLEYSICVFAAVMAIAAMVVYVKRGVSGRYADVVRATASSAGVGQYEPYYEANSFLIDQNMTAAQNITNRGGRITDYTSAFVKQGSRSETGDPE